MRTHRTDLTTADVRAAGPAVVRSGPADAQTVLVLDPWGEAKHAGLPATWRPLTEDVHVVWWRLPAAARAGLTNGALTGELADVEGPVHVVGADDAAPLALSLAAHHLDQVRSVVLVGHHVPDGDTHGVAVRLVPGGSIHSAHLPLGHRTS